MSSHPDSILLILDKTNRKPFALYRFAVPYHELDKTTYVTDPFIRFNLSKSLPSERIHPFNFPELLPSSPGHFVPYFSTQTPHVYSNDSSNGNAVVNLIAMLFVPRTQ